MGAHEGDDDRAFYHAAIERTYPIISVTTSGNDQFSDDVGALPQGRYLIQAVNFSDTTALCWVHVGKFEDGSPIAMAATPGMNKVPLTPSGAVAIEYNVIRGVNDRIGAVLSAGTCSLLITRVSRTSPQANV